MSWTEAKLETLKKLWTEGASYSSIAKQIGGGLTRSAIAGKVRRIGLPYRKDPRDSAAACIARVQRARQKAQAARKRAVVFIPNKVLKPTKTELLRTELALIAALPSIDESLTVATLRPNQCRYINGDPKTDGTFCGRASDGSWCSQHRKLVYQPSKPKAKASPRTYVDDERRRQLRELARLEQFQMGVAV